MEPASSSIRTLRVFRVEEGTTSHVRTLSQSYSGLFTHFVRGQGSKYCRGDKCDTITHKLDRVWKGYAAVEVWNVSAENWMPAALEISEALELDFRGLWRRGQEWELFRDFPQGKKKKKQPVIGKLHKEHDPASMPPTFDFRPVLLHLYHVEIIQLGDDNPMPPRIIIADSVGEAPAAIQGIRSDKDPIDPEAERKWREQLNTRYRTPTERKQS